VPTCTLFTFLIVRRCALAEAYASQAVAPRRDRFDCDASRAVRAVRRARRATGSIAIASASRTLGQTLPQSIAVCRSSGSACAPATSLRKPQRLIVSHSGADGCER
jgi:hypothetical protein